MRVLLIEDEPDIADLLELHFSDMGFVVDKVNDGEGGLLLARDCLYRLIVLDLMLPGLDGLEICRELRKDTIMCPVLVLTAKVEASVEAMAAGARADDFMRKPFSVAEVLTRSMALMGRSEPIGSARQVEQPILKFGPFVVDSLQREVLRDNAPIHLTNREFDLLVFLARNSGRVYDFKTLLRSVWGYEHQDFELTVGSHVARLQTLICDSESPSTYIQTVPGGGCRFVPLPQSE